LVLFVLAVAGGGLNRFAAPALSALRRAEPELRLESARAAGPGVVFALLGGFRALAADVAWLGMHHAWERRDWAAANTLLHLVATIDPRPLYFWLNGARIMAFDFASWRSAVPGSPWMTPVHDVARREQARAALRYLSGADLFHGATPRLFIERAGIELHGRGDPAAAAESYRRAAVLPGCPPFAARLHATLLCRLGRPGDALAWLRQIRPSLPPGDDLALVQDRIRELSVALGEEKAIQSAVDR
jgi:hypothetical protein